MKYSIDTSAILDGWRRYYPPDIFPPLWGKLSQLIRDGDLIATEEVLIEIKKRDDDEVYAWVQQHRNMFVPIDEQIQLMVAEILKDHPKLIDTRPNRSKADPFVIALARLHGCAVVTGERPSNSSSRPNIPDVCALLKIRSINLLQLIREQGWRFQ